MYSITYDKPRSAPNLTEGTFPVPEYVYNITNQDLHSHTPVDLVIIIPTSQKLLKQAQRLAAFHEQHDGIKVRIVPADEIFNEFSSGTPDAMAYRRYMKCYTIVQKQKPKYQSRFYFLAIVYGIIV